jgi:hypothetical protein
MSLSIEDQHRNARKLCMEAEQLLQKTVVSPLDEQKQCLAQAKSALDSIKGLLVRGKKIKIWTFFTGLN